MVWKVWASGPIAISSSDSSVISRRPSVNATAWPMTDATMPLPMTAGKAAPPHRVDADVERAADGRRRAEHEEPDPEPEPCRKAAARLGVLPEQHLDPVDRGEDHDREHEVRVMHLRAGDEPEGREADVEGEGGSGEDEHGPRHAGELRSVHGLGAKSGRAGTGRSWMQVLLFAPARVSGKRVMPAAKARRYCG